MWNKLFIAICILLVTVSCKQGEHRAVKVGDTLDDLISQEGKPVFSCSRVLQDIRPTYLSHFYKLSLKDFWISKKSLPKKMIGSRWLVYFDKVSLEEVNEQLQILIDNDAPSKKTRLKSFGQTITLDKLSQPIVSCWPEKAGKINLYSVNEDGQIQEFISFRANLILLELSRELSKSELASIKKYAKMEFYKYQKLFYDPSITIGNLFHKPREKDYLHYYIFFYSLIKTNKSICPLAFAVMADDAVEVERILSKDGYSFPLDEDGKFENIYFLAYKCNNKEIIKLLEGYEDKLLKDNEDKKSKFLPD